MPGRWYVESDDDARAIYLVETGVYASRIDVLPTPDAEHFPHLQGQWVTKTRAFKEAIALRDALNERDDDAIASDSVLQDDLGDQ